MGALNSKDSMSDMEQYDENDNAGSYRQYAQENVCSEESGQFELYSNSNGANQYTPQWLSENPSLQNQSLHFQGASKKKKSLKNYSKQNSNFKMQRSDEDASAMTPIKMQNTSKARSVTMPSFIDPRSPSAKGADGVAVLQRTPVAKAQFSNFTQSSYSVADALIDPRSPTMERTPVRTGVCYENIMQICKEATSNLPTTPKPSLIRSSSFSSTSLTTSPASSSASSSLQVENQENFSFGNNHALISDEPKEVRKSALQSSKPIFVKQCSNVLPRPPTGVLHHRHSFSGFHSPTTANTVIAKDGDYYKNAHLFRKRIIVANATSSHIPILKETTLVHSTLKATKSASAAMAIEGILEMSMDADCTVEVEEDDEEEDEQEEGREETENGKEVEKEEEEEEVAEYIEASIAALPPSRRRMSWSPDSSALLDDFVDGPTDAHFSPMKTQINSEDDDANAAKIQYMHHGMENLVSDAKSLNFDNIFEMEQSSKGIHSQATQRHNSPCNANEDAESEEEGEGEEEEEKDDEDDDYVEQNSSGENNDRGAAHGEFKDYDRSDEASNNSSFLSSSVPSSFATAAASTPKASSQASIDGSSMLFNRYINGRGGSSLQGTPLSKRASLQFIPMSINCKGTNDHAGALQSLQVRSTTKKPTTIAAAAAFSNGHLQSPSNLKGTVVSRNLFLYSNTANSGMAINSSIYNNKRYSQPLDLSCNYLGITKHQSCLQINDKENSVESSHNKMQTPVKKNPQASDKAFARLNSATVCTPLKPQNQSIDSGYSSHGDGPGSGNISASDSPIIIPNVVV